GNGGAGANLASSGIVDNSHLAFNASDTITYASVISGTGTLAQNGTGTTVLTANETYTGSTTISNGTLQIGNGGAGANLASSGIVDNGHLIFNASAIITYANVISGNGTVTQNGTGTTVLTGNETYTGVTTINAGTLQIGNGGNSGNLASLTITDNSNLVFNVTSTLTYNGVISGTGNVTQAGTGTVILVNNNNYSGNTTINPGTTLQVGNNTVSGSLGTGALLNYGTWAINLSTPTTFANVISGNGALSQLGSGLMTLTGNNTYTGNTNIGVGSTLQIGNGGTSGNVVSANINDSGTLVYNLSGNLTYTGVISGTGNVTQNGSGTVILTGNETYTGITTINAGTLQIGNGGAGANLVSSAIVDNSNLVFDASDTITYANVISGTGTVSQNGTGTTVLTANETYTGITTINNGTLQIGNGGAGANLVSSAIVDNSHLVFDESDTITYANVISGNGTVTQNGTGTTVLTGNETYTGVTTINAGTLQIGNDGAGANLVSSAIVDNGRLVFDASDTITYANVISGNGTVTQNGTGTTVLTANETYTGVTTINAGTLQIGNGGAGANLASSGIVDNSHLVFNASDTITYANV
ncbi:MAG: autotransporter-associated beta strand repeat-containing protein, partial [Plesiomonas shigelloides]